MKAILSGCVVLLLITAVLSLNARPPKPAEERNLIMQQKLLRSQKVLEGIAVADFSTIENNAAELVRLSQNAEWKVLQSPEYALVSNEFRRNAESLAQMATAKNLDGATLAYFRLTMNCVECHKYVRQARTALNDGNGERRVGTPVAPTNVPDDLGH